MQCFECFYSMFGQCPTYGSQNAACLSTQKAYLDMSPKELKNFVEDEYKQKLIDAAKMYHVKMDLINNLFESNSDNEEKFTH